MTPTRSRKSPSRWTASGVVLVLLALTLAPGSLDGPSIVAAGPPSLDATKATTTGWQQLLPEGAPGSPPGQMGPAVWDTQANRLLVFGGAGGYSADGTPRGDLWSYSVGSGWRQLGADGAPGSPPRRYSHVAVWDSAANRLLVFGGCQPANCFSNDLWEWTAAGGWRQLTADGATGSPPGRNGSAAVWDTQANRLLLFAGQVPSCSDCFAAKHVNDLWEYTAAGGWRLPVANGAAGSPPSRFDHTAVWDSHENRLLVLGGNENSGVSNVFGDDLWSYTAAGGWRSLPSAPALDVVGDSSQPGRRTGWTAHTAVWDNQSNRMLVVGGENLQCCPNVVRNNDLLAYSTAGGWTVLTDQRLTPAPTARVYPASAWDSSARRLLVFGGWTAGGVTNDFWSFQ